MSADAAGGAGPDGAGSFDGRLYARATSHHRAHDAAALGGLTLEPGQDVLDLGCGVGDLTLRLWEAVQPGGSVTGVDASASVLATAAEQAGPREALTWVHAPAQGLAAVVAPASVDAVVSVATLHWVPQGDQAGVLAGVASVLRPGGTLRVDMGGHGQLAGVLAVLDRVSAEHGGGACPLFFPDVATYRSLLAGAGLDVGTCELVAQRRDLGAVSGVEAWLRSQVLPAYLPGLEPGRREAFAAAAVAAVLDVVEVTGSGHAVEYVRLQASARR